ncbi:TetR/AcrR family transcriptional regulator [Gordonia sp. NPDC127522]|uniref:TetR/AcrR family transcriptional regulator n=1 Tax=Gordonia sp. NPDC127522 TaxID=3345390 RepID=UPI00363DF654
MVENVERVSVVAAAAVRVIARAGLRGLTHRAVDAEAGLSEGATSNCFRTRSALIEGVVQWMADQELADLDAAQAEGNGTAAFDQWAREGREQTLARLELMLEGVREPVVAAALASQRARFAAYASKAGVAERVGLSADQLVALLAGVQFAEVTTGQPLLPLVAQLLEGRG